MSAVNERTALPLSVGFRIQRLFGAVILCLSSVCFVWARFKWAFGVESRARLFFHELNKSDSPMEYYCQRTLSIFNGLCVPDEEAGGDGGGNRAERKAKRII